MHKWILVPVFLILLFSVAVSSEENNSPEDFKKFLDTNNPNFINLATSTSLSQDPTPVKTYYKSSGHQFVPSESTGYMHRPESTVRNTMRTIDAVVFDSTYNFDKFGNRVNPIAKSQKYKFISLFGCSFTYGYGVNDNETLHYYLSQENQEYYAYNQAIGGSGTHMMLADLREKSVLNEVPEDEGFYIYVFIDFHIQRANGFMQERAWMNTTPVFEKENQKLISKGSFEKVQPIKTWFYRFLNETLNISKHLGMNFPKLGKTHINYTCDLIEESQKEFLSQKPKGKFVVYQHPLSEKVPQLKECLEKRTIEYWNSKIQKNEKSQIPFDGHPTAALNKKIAAEILSFIGRK